MTEPDSKAASRARTREAKPGNIIVSELAKSAETLIHSGPYWAYHRVSSDEQRRRKTIEGQRNDTEAWARMRGVKFDHVEEDDGHSGTTISGRPAFTRVLEACRNGEVGTLVVVAPDRLTRAEEWSDRAQIWDALRKHRVLLVMTGFCEIDPFSETADLLLSQAFTLASMERRRMRARSFRGKMRAAESGRLPQGQPPYARSYRRETGTWGIVEDEAVIYRRMFSMVLQGLSTNDIPTVLNGEGVPSPGGKGWRQSHVSELLRSRAALGEYTTLDQTFEIPAIIDAETFEAVGRTLSARRRIGGPQVQHPRLLNRMMKCGECGSTMHVRTCGKPANRQQAYRCGQWHPGNLAKPGFVRPACAMKQHNADVVDAAVWKEVERLLRDPEFLRVATGITSSTAPNTWETDIAAAEKELRSLERQTQNLMRLYRKELVSEQDLEKQLGEVGRQRTGVEQRLQAAISRRDVASAMRATAASYADRMSELASRASTTSLEERRALLRLLFPQREPYGLRLFPDGRLEAEGGVPLPPEQPSPSPNSASDNAKTSNDQPTAARRSPGCSSHPPRRSSREGHARASRG